MGQCTYYKHAQCDKVYARAPRTAIGMWTGPIPARTARPAQRLIHVHGLIIVSHGDKLLYQ